MALAGFAYFKNSFEVHYLCVRDIVRQFDLSTFAAIKLFQNGIPENRDPGPPSGTPKWDPKWVPLRGPRSQFSGMPFKT